MNSRTAALWALGVIFAANFLNYLDRQLVSALERPISGTLALAQWEYGLLWSLFTIGYMLCAVPIGLLADRYSRTRLFAVCIVIWSVATIVSGLAPNKWVLYPARVFIGVGEAGCLVIGPSLISDLFSRRVRAKALSWFYLAMPLGGTGAFLLAALPFNIDWRNLFYLAGAPGFLIAGLIWSLPDPERGASEGAQHGMPGGGLGDYLRLLRTPTLLLIILAQAFAVVILVPLIHYGAQFFEDDRHMGAKQARLALGIMALVGGCAGSLASGFVGDRLFRRTRRAYAILAAVSYLATVPCLYIGFADERQEVFLTALTIGSFFLFLCMPAVNTQIANVVSPAQRATAWALAVFILHLLGDLLAPPIFGLVSNAIGRQQAFSVFSVALLGAALCCLGAIFTARRDTERVSDMITEMVREKDGAARSANGSEEGTPRIPEASGA
jgi:predicted MFS family arabinose efflux permease